MTKNLERKKKGQTHGRTNSRMPICNPTIQLVVVDLYTKYEVSILNGCGDILDKNLERKKDKKNKHREEQNRRRPIFNPTIQFVVVNPYTRFKVSILNGCGDIFNEISGKKEKGTNKRKNK